MKKIIYSLMIIAGLVAMPGCNDDFMEHSPKDSLTEETVFSTVIIYDFALSLK